MDFCKNICPQVNNFNKKITEMTQKYFTKWKILEAFFLLCAVSLLCLCVDESSQTQPGQ